MSGANHFPLCSFVSAGILPISVNIVRLSCHFPCSPCSLYIVRGCFESRCDCVHGDEINLDRESTVLHNLREGLALAATGAFERGITSPSDRSKRA